MRKYTILEEFKLEHKSAHVHPYRVGNILFTGDSAGIVDPFLGFGQLSAITTGVMAARSIVHGADYSCLIKDVTKKNNDLFNFRKALNGSNNMGYDLLMATIGLPGIKHLLYYTSINVTKVGSFFIKHLPVPKKL